MKDVRQPVLILQGELDTQVLPYHADRLAELARARKRKVAVDIAKVPGVNHLLVTAKTGEVDEIPGTSREEDLDGGHHSPDSVAGKSAPLTDHGRRLRR